MNSPATAGLRIWDKPASACLSSRIEYGREVTREALLWSSREKTPFAHWASASFGCVTMATSFASRSPAKNLARALTAEMAGEFTRIFKALGFKFVTLDLEGFRSGSMNALLTADVLTRGR